MVYHISEHDPTTGYNAVISEECRRFANDRDIELKVKYLVVF